MGFLLLWQIHIYTDDDEKEVERDMHAAILYFWNFNDQDEYEK